MDAIKQCLDTYALVEISEGNNQFLGYLSKKFIITELTLAEFYYVLLREKGESTADHWFKKFEQYTVPVPKNLLQDIMKFKH